MDSSSDAYRSCLKENSELRAVLGVLIGALEREVLESIDPLCQMRLEPALARAHVVSCRSGNSPRRTTDPEPVRVLSKPLPVVPVKVNVISETPQMVVAAAEPMPTKILPAGGTLGRRAPVAMPRLNLRPAGGASAPRSNESLVPSPRGRPLRSPTGPDKSPRMGLERLPILMFGLIAGRIPAESVAALACCSSACRDMVAKWRRMSSRSNVVMEIVSSEQSYLNMLVEALKYRTLLVGRNLLSAKDADVCFNGKHFSLSCFAYNSKVFLS